MAERKGALSPRLVISQFAPRPRGGGRLRVEQAVFIWFGKAIHAAYDPVLEETIPEDWYQLAKAQTQASC